MKRFLVFGFIILGALLIGVSFFVFKNSHQTEASSVGSITWTDKVGNGLAMPACSSATPTFSCYRTVNGQQETVKIEWAYGTQHGICSYAIVTLSDGQTTGQTGCDGLIPFNINENTNYTYTIDFYSWHEGNCDTCSSGYTIMDTYTDSFLSPQCVLPPPPSVLVNLTVNNQKEVYLPYGSTAKFKWGTAGSDPGYCIFPYWDANQHQLTQMPDWTTAKMNSSNHLFLYCYNVANGQQGQDDIIIHINPKTTDLLINGKKSVAVNSGDIAHLSWVSSGVDYCKLAGDNTQFTPDNADYPTQPITNPQTFTLTCTAFDGTTVSDQVDATIAPLNVGLTAVPDHGGAPLNVALTASVSGAQAGNINYYFWWDCNQGMKKVHPAEQACGDLPVPVSGSCVSNPIGAICEGINANSQTINTTYNSIGNYMPKVIVVDSSGNSEEKRTPVNVTACTPGDVTSWSQCSPSCGPGTQTRQICNNSGNWVNDVPLNCNLGPCGPSAPICTLFSANPSSLLLSGNSILSWDCSTGGQVDSCTINNGVGNNLSSSGNKTVNVNSTKTYNLSCTGPGGNSNNLQTTITVGFIPKIIEILPRF